MRNLFLFICFLLGVNSATDAQQRRNILLDSFSGNWKGTVEINDEPLIAELQCTWILGGSFQQWDLIAYRSGRETNPALRERLIIGMAGEDRLSVYRFDSEGVSWWGVREGKGKHWQHELDASNGSRETGVLEWESAKSFSIVATIMDEQGNVTKTLRFSLNRQ